MIFYLLCSIAGAIVPWYFNITQQIDGPEPFTLSNYLAAGFANPFVSSISTDFIIGTTPVLVWMIVEGMKLKMKHLWFYVVFTFAIAFAFTCPLFLFMRERVLQKNVA